MAALITAAEYESLVNESLGSLPSAYIDYVLEAASNELQNWCGVTFGEHTVTDEETEALARMYNRQPVLWVEVSHTPLVSVSSLAVWYAIDADPTDLDVDDAVIGAAKTGFYVPFGTFGLWTTFFRLGQRYRARVSYTAGEAVRTEIKRAVALLAQEIFALDAAASKSGTDAVESYRIGDYQEKKAARDLSASDGLGLGTQNSILAARIVAGFRRRGVVMI
ncbi:MAG TPA: hypothetical protein EYH32_00430 [Anaerolineae bacterium]|nr:hypothetical protein [Anaerolineae bacterium]